jgi:cation transport protein ChaC
MASELPVLWSREMLLGGYNPVWVDVLDEDEKKFGVAISFVIDPDHEHYAGNLPHDEKIHRLSTARGSWGSSADYLFRTIRALQERGICDEEIERLGEMVAAVTGEALRDAA